MFGMNLGNLMVKLSAVDAGFTRVLRGAQRTFDMTAAKAKMMGQQMKRYVTLPIIAMATASTFAYGQFDDAMTKSIAIMSDVNDSVRAEMEATARGISRSSITSSTELAKSYFYLASAGLNAQQSMASLAAVEKFAVAGAFDMSLATDLLTDAQSALGLSSKNTEEHYTNMVRLSDVLVRANTLANASVEQFSRALTNKAAAALRMLNKDVEEGVAVLAAFADQGVKDVEAGEKLYMVLRDLQSASLKKKDAWRQMGLSVYDTQGKMLPLVNIIAQLENKFSTMSDQQKKSTATMLGFQDRSFIAIQNLIGTSDKIRDYETALRSAGGFTQSVADKQRTSFVSQLKIVKNNVMGAAGALGKVFAPWVLNIANYVKDLAQRFNSLSDSQKRWVGIILMAAAAIGPALIVFGLLAASLGAIVGFFSLLSAGAVIAFGLLAAKVLLVVGVVAGLVYGIKEVIEHLWGNKVSLKNAFVRVLEVAKSVFFKLAGFLQNYKQNWEAFIKWLPENWKNVFVDIFNFVGVVNANLAHNMKVILVTILRLMASFSGHMIGLWKEIFTDGFLKAVWDGIKKVGRVYLDFVEAKRKLFLSIFTMDFKGVKNQFKNFLKGLGEDFEKGLHAESFLEEAGRIIKEQTKQIKTPWEGFKSSITEMPEFNFDFKAPDWFFETPKILDEDLGIPGGMNKALEGWEDAADGVENLFKDIVPEFQMPIPQEDQRGRALQATSQSEILGLMGQGRIEQEDKAVQRQEETNALLRQMLMAMQNFTPLYGE